MKDARDDTIAAIATPPGVSAVAIVRISGSDARRIAAACFEPLRGGPLRPAHVRRGWVRDPATQARVDDALALLFAAPNSYTGEDVIELHVHGGAGVVASVLAHVVAAGARLAAPGEFTRRAFVNGKLDLAQAEAVADLIDAQSRQAAAAAAARLEGALGRALREMREALTARLVEIEAHVDYPDEVPAPQNAALAAIVREQAARVDASLAGSGAARALRDGIDCVIAGPPNAGKSSLLNALLDAERAIVSDLPGTTRDIVEDRVAVDGVVLRLRDTAGLRATSDTIEAEGVARARRAIGAAELVIVVVDGSQPLGPDAREALAASAGRPRIVLRNKLDLGDAPAGDLAQEPARSLRIDGSVRWPQTIAALREAIARLGWGGGAIAANSALVANARQSESLTRAREALAHAQATIAVGAPVDLLAGDLRAAIAAYGEVTGETVTEDVLDGIFARFCVGK
jgi:tRNA modification GTPase